MDDHDADGVECESSHVSSLLELFSPHGVEQARRFEYVPQSVAPLVTGVLEHAGMIRTRAQIEPTVHGAVHVAGSTNVAWYAIVSLPVRVKRSTSFSDEVEPRGVVFRLAVSTTSAVPSQ